MKAQAHTSVKDYSLAGGAAISVSREAELERRADRWFVT
jgi:hypothetical protein